MKCVRTWHKKAGLVGAFLIFLLSLTGYFLNHDQWSFQYQLTLPNTLLPKSVTQAETKLFETKTRHPQQSQWQIIGGMRGVFISKNGGQSFQQTSDLQIYALRWLEHEETPRLLAATQKGIIQSKDFGQTWQPWALQNQWVNALAVSKQQILAAVEKQQLVLLNSNAEIIHQNSIKLPANQLASHISLSRLVRDIHYGRGLFDYGASIWLNDISAFLLIFSTLSGLFIWWSLRRAKRNTKSPQHHNSPTINPLKWVKRILRLHSHSIMIIFLPIAILLAITGVALDHAKALGSIMNQTKLSQYILPPVYKTLSSDIWSIDIEQQQQKTWVRFGNRYGVYQTENFETKQPNWQRVSNGFAYRMIRLNNQLFVSGMGSQNRQMTTISKKTPTVSPFIWSDLTAPRMFKDVYLNKQNIPTFYMGHQTNSTNHAETFHDKSNPKLTNSSFYSVMLTLHNGSFFANWWIWINDIAAILLIILLITGTLRWSKQKHRHLLFKKRN